MKKSNRIRHPGHRRALVFAVLGIAVLSGLILGYNKLRDLWLEQCVIRDMVHQVSVESGRMVKADLVCELLGLRPGANLATIDFAEKRTAILAKVPNLREIRIRRHLPDRISVTLEEREPVARLGFLKSRSDTGRVVDVEGVVFLCSRGTSGLPIIREASAPGTGIGRQLEGRARAALEFLCACRDPAYQELGVLEADVSHPDWLLASLNTGTRFTSLKIAWSGMTESPTPESHASLLRQLTHLRDAMRTHLADGAAVWNATDFSFPGRIYADTKGKL